MAWLQANWPVIVSVLWGISEALALIPQVKSNSVFTLIYNALKYLRGGDQPAIKGK
jgi:hypothetical protein